MKLFPLLAPAGSDTQVQYNKNNLFGGDIALTWDDGAAKALTIGNCAVLGADSAVFQPNADSTTFLQVKNAAGTGIAGNFDTTNIRFGIGTPTPAERLHVAGANGEAIIHYSYNAAGQYTARMVTHFSAASALANWYQFEVCDSSVAGRTTPLVLYGNEYAHFSGKIGIGLIHPNKNPDSYLEIRQVNPSMILHNSTHEDTDGGGESRIIGKREDGAGTETAAGQIEISHDGVVANDQLGKMILGVNTGAGVVDALIIDSARNVIAEQGVFSMSETTTPTAITNNGAIYTTSDNELFFQDGAGVEHLLHGDAFSNIWFHSISSVEVAIATQDAFTKIDSFTAVGHEDDLLNVVGSTANNNLTLASVGGGEYEISYHGSITATGGVDKEMDFAVGITLATPKDITNVTDDTVTPIVITSVGHGLENGDMVEIAGVLVNTAANGSFIVDSKAADTFVIVNLDGSATTGNGNYDEGSPTGDVTIFYPGNLEIHRMVRGADFGSISATAFHVLAGGDVLALYVANLSGVTNLTVSSVSLGVNRIGD